MVIIVILSITVYNYKKKQIRYYLLSVQQFPELKMSINIQKTQGKISAILIEFTENKDISLSDVRIELISKKRELNFYSLQLLVDSVNFPLKLNAGSKTELNISFDDFRDLLMDGEYPFSTFRFVALSEKGQVYKSHEMGFDKKWIIYRPDSGTYN